jgi:hypothetical protein
LQPLQGNIVHGVAWVLFVPDVLNHDAGLKERDKERRERGLYAVQHLDEPLALT